MSTRKLFEEWSLRSLKFRNRVGVSPMCQYSCENGYANDWHLVHLGSRAVGGAGVVIAEATAVEARGRISYGDAGLWEAGHVKAWQPVTKFIREQGAVPVIQLAHAGRKGSTDLPWLGGKALAPSQPNGWEVVGPSALAFSENYFVPHVLDKTEIKKIREAFVQSTRWALAAGFQVVELHAAHGYLLHEFLSPLSNKRTDEYGGSLENRMRFVLETAQAMRAEWPADLPIFTRISATDWEGPQAWNIGDSVELSRALQKIGVDLIDVSSGGNTPHPKIPLGPLYQTHFAEQIRREVPGLATATVGAITQAAEAQMIVTEEKADLVLMAREFLRDPYWPRRAAKELGQSVMGPQQYGRAW